MITSIKNMAQATRIETGRASLNQNVMDIMAKVPRHDFVPDEQNASAYDNRPLPIGYGQTISQPYIVALMTDVLEVKSSDVVLEIGTGSGYQAAILGELVEKVYSIEIIEDLGKEAKERLARLGYNKVEVKIGDGYYGWEEHAPFDSIIVTAAAQHIPPPLIQQLKLGGRMIIPLGKQLFVQNLTLLEKNEQAKIKTSNILPVVFVPFTGEH